MASSFLSVEIVHQRHQFGVFKPLMPEKLPHMRPVLLLAVRVVVLAVRPAAGEGHFHFPPRQLLIQRPVEELRPVVGVEVFQLKRCLGFQFLQLAENGVAVFVPYGAVLRPPAEQLGER